MQPTALRWGQSFLENRRTLGLVSLLAIIFLSTTNLPWQLDEYSQERQALSSFDMIKEGRWLYQQAPRERDATKPPLIPWISAGVFAATRSWDIAWRLPSFLAAISLSILLFRSSIAAFGAGAGLLALAAFTLNNLTPRLATLVRTDMPLTLIVFLVGLHIWQKIRKQEEWESRDRWLVFALLTIGLFIKGPIIYAFLLPSIAAFQWRWRNENVANAWCGWWPWLAALGIFLLWVIGGLVTQPGFFDQVIMHEFLGRFGTTEQRPHPPYYYLGHLLQKFAPWSELLILLAVQSVRASGVSIRASIRKISPDTFWLVCWSLGGLIFMSLIPSKRLDRILPAIPPLCLLLAAQTARAFPNEQLRERAYRWSVAALLLSILLTSDYAVSKVFYGYRDHRDALVTFGREVRSEARAHHWRYEIMESHDGGMLLYLDKAHFIEPNRAVAEWNRGNLDALVVRSAEAPELMRALPDAVSSGVGSRERTDGKGKDYLLIIRRATTLR